MNIDYFKKQDIKNMQSALRYVIDNFDRIKTVLNEDLIAKTSPVSIKYPRNYCHNVNVEVLKSKIVIINTHRYAFIFDDHTIIKRCGVVTYNFQHDLSKDEFFNMSINYDTYGLTFEDLEIISTIKTVLGGIISGQQC
ncbi:hypothetical protein XaC1_536 [Xanthomonas phage XaC1]|nr:hypothetical protein XaC1_536 [Xanthomonas phage XaC1]